MKDLTLLQPQEDKEVINCTCGTRSKFHKDFCPMYYQSSPVSENLDLVERIQLLDFVPPGCGIRCTTVGSITIRQDGVVTEMSGEWEVYKTASPQPPVSEKEVPMMKYCVCSGPDHLPNCPESSEAKLREKLKPAPRPEEVKECQHYKPFCTRCDGVGCHLSWCPIQGADPFPPQPAPKKIEKISLLADSYGTKAEEILRIGEKLNDGLDKMNEIIEVVNRLKGKEE